MIASVMKQTLIFSSIFLALTLSSAAWSDEPEESSGEQPQPVVDGCTTLETNPMWLSQFDEFTKTFKKEDYQKALDITKELQKICADSPLLNYSIGMTYRSMGDNTNSLKYLKTATRNTEQFKVDQNIVERMYYAQYEVENAEKLKANKEEEEAMIAPANLDLQQVHQRNKILMWTGVGMMGAGLAMQLGLLATNDNWEFYKNNEDMNKGKKLEDYYLKVKPAGWILSGVGIGLAVAGAVMTGFAGYYYTHPAENKKVSFNYNISPTSLGMGMKF